MNIIKLVNGKYRTQVYDRFGKRHRRSFSRKYEAEAFIRKIESQKNEDKLVRVNLIKSRVSFEKAIIDFWSNRTNLSSKTEQKYRTELLQIDIFRKSNGLEFIDEFTRQHSDLFKSMLIKSGASPKTVNSYLMRLKSIFREQYNRDSLTRDPTSHLTNLKIKQKTLLQKEDEYYNVDEVKAFFSQRIEPEYRLAFAGLFLTGMRFEELANLTQDFVDLNRKMIMIRSNGEFSTKTPTSERDIPISNTLYFMLTQALSSGKKEYVFHSRYGTKLSERTLLTVCKRTAKEAGIMKTATLHKFRHTFSSLLSHYGVSYEVRECLLGHKPTGSLTGHYTKLNPINFHGIVSLLDKHLIESKNNY